MAQTDFRAEILRRGRHEDTITVHGDPTDASTLRTELENWLAREGYSRALWNQFTIATTEVRRIEVRAA